MKDARRILITGSNRGLGRKAAELLAAKGHRLVVTARDQRKCDAACAALRGAGAQVDGVVVDLASAASIRSALGPLRELGPYDVVLHNAGVLLADEQQKKTVDGFEEALQVNALAPLWLTEELKDSLARPARIVIVGSMLHEPGSRGEEVDLRLDDPNLDHNYHHDRAYKNSKLAQFWIQQVWEQDLAPDGVHTDVVCPGFVPSTAAEHVDGIMRWSMRHVMPHLPFAHTVEQGAEILVSWCLRPLDEPGGRYFDGGQVKLPSDDAQDPDKAKTFVRWARAGWDS